MTRVLLALLLLSAPAVAQTAAQPELPKEKLVIVTHDGTKHDFNVEMAVQPEQQTVGLMFRPSVPEDGGMLFDWGRPQSSTMWMRNTVAPLDMLFINADGTVRRVVHDTVPQSLAIIESRGPVRAPRDRRAGPAARPPNPAGGKTLRDLARADAVRATLELRAGTAERLHIHAGDKVEAPIFGQ